MMCFEEWRNCVLANCGHYHSTPSRSGHGGKGDFRLRRQHGIDIAEMECQIDRIDRRHADIRRDQNEYFFLLVQKTGETHVAHNHREERLTPGDCLLLDSTLPAELRYQGRAASFISVHLPRALCLEGRKAAPVPGRRIGRSHPLSASLHNLLAQAEEDSGADCLLDFVGLMFRAEPVAGHAPGLRDRHSRFRFICGTVEQHLSDPDFCIDRLASLVNMSRRQLQRDFSDHGTTFTRLLTERRVRLIASHLRRAAQMDRRAAIAELAFRAGFGDLSHLNRSFRAHYGQSPRGYHALCKAEAPVA